MPIELSVREARVSDCRECAQLLTDQMTEHGVVSSVEALSQLLESVIVRGSSGVVFLARADERVAGVAYMAMIPSVEHCGPVAWLEELYVKPAVRGRGIGTELVNAVIEWAHRAGMVAVELEVDAGHRRAEALYQRAGFRRLDRSRWVKELSTEKA